MALESVDSNPPFSGGMNEKQTLQDDGENHSDGEIDPDLEEGEILDSAGEAKEGDEKRTKKKKKKKRKKRPNSDVAENGREKKRKYVDHDKVNSGEDQSPDHLRKHHHHHHKSRSSGQHSSPKKLNGAKRKHDDTKVSPSGRGAPQRDHETFEDEFNPSDEYYSDDGKDHGKDKRPIKPIKNMKKKRMERGRGGKINRRPIHDQKVKTRICKFYMEGKCLKDDDCTYLHDVAPPKKNELCKYYLQGFCRSGGSCLFMHEDFPCKFFHTGVKCFSNENCKFSHDPLTDETKVMLAKCLDSGRLPGEDRSMGKRLSLLGTPPKKVNNEPYDPKKSNYYNSLRNRPNFYIDGNQDEGMNDYGEMDDYGEPNDFGNHTPVYCEEHEGSWDGDEDRDFGNKDGEFDSQDDGQPTQKVELEEEEEGKQQSQEIPVHLPKRQRELFLRIQQQQREAEIQQEEVTATEVKEEEENWYSDDDEEGEEGDQPLTVVLKKLQQNSETKSEPVNPVLDISSMISAIRNQSTQSKNDEEEKNKKTLPRDPRMKDSRIPSDEISSPPITNKNILQRSKDEYFLISMEISVPGNYNRYAIASQTNGSLKNDPRIQRVVDKFGCIENIIIEEEKKFIPTLPDFIPPPNIMSPDIIDPKILPNYSKGIDPRTGRRPPLLPPPPHEGQQDGPVGHFNFPRNFPTPPIRPQMNRFQQPEQFNQWPQRMPDTSLFSPPRGLERANFNNQQNMQMMNIRPGNPPFQMGMQGSPKMNQVRNVDVVASRDPRKKRMEPDPRNANMQVTEVKLTPEVSFKDPRLQRSTSQTEILNNSEGPPITNILDPTVKNMFRAIDPTASPFC